MEPVIFCETVGPEASELATCGSGQGISIVAPSSWFHALFGNVAGNLSGGPRLTLRAVSLLTEKASLSLSC